MRSPTRSDDARPRDRRPAAVTAGSGVAIGLPAELRGSAAAAAAARLPPAPGAARDRLRQLFRARRTRRSRISSRAVAQACALDPLALAAGGTEVERALDWARPRLGSRPGAGLRHRRAGRGARRCSSASAPTRAGALVERALAAIARGLVARRRAAADRGGRRDRGRRGAGARRARAAHRPARSTRACRGARATPRPRRRRCTSRSSRATSAAPDFFTTAPSRCCR